MILFCATLAIPGVPASSPATKPSRKLPQRIVSLSPNNTEILFALGVGGRVVGVTSRCNYPPEAKKKAKVGDMNTSIERVIGLHPDLVVANSGLNAPAVTRLRSLKIRVVAGDPQTYGETISYIRMVGKETGSEKRAEQIVGRMLSAVKSAQSGPKSHKKVLVVAQSSPLWTAGPKTFVDDMIGFLHGENVGRDTASGKFNQMSTETAVARNPDVIISALPADKGYFERSPIWRNTSAVKRHKIVIIDGDLIFRAGPRLANGLELMAKAVK